MQKNLSLCLKCLVVALLLTSCASTKFQGNAVLAGRVYDTHGRPVPNYHISVGLGLNAITDSGGVFTFKNLPSGTYTISGGANGWCGIEQEFFFHDRKEIVCLEVEKLEDLIQKVDFLVSDGDFSGANALLSKAKSHNEKNPIFLSLKKLVDYCESPTEKRKQKLLSSLEKI